jgi:hypothetical protein
MDRERFQRLRILQREATLRVKRNLPTRTNEFSGVRTRVGVVELIEEKVWVGS